jgi:hypothetical protein
MDVDAKTILALYRTRWQIELAFKRLKSLLELGELKKTDPASARAWIQGKLMLACLIEKMIATGSLFSPRAPHERTARTSVPLARNRMDARLAGAGNPPRTVIAENASTLE